jgi:hypothetical protein
LGVGNPQYGNKDEAGESKCPQRFHGIQVDGARGCAKNKVTRAAPARGTRTMGFIDTYSGSRAIGCVWEKRKRAGAGEHEYERWGQRDKADEVQRIRGTRISY